jgi:hypothetical protein
MARTMVPKKNPIVEKLTAAMLRRGWPFQTLSGLPDAYMRDELVTPYFYCSYVRPKPHGAYVIDGAVGVVHQGFEKMWMQIAEKTPRENRFCVVLDIANVTKVSQCKALRGVDLGAEVENFADAICSFLESMPQNQSDLIRSFRCGSICGIPTKNFSGYSAREKFCAFDEFLGKLAEPKLH